MIEQNFEIWRSCTPPLMPMLWVVPFIQVFAESRNAYLCIMQGSVSNFADFQFWPYCPSLKCSYFCPSLPPLWNGYQKISLRVVPLIQHQVHAKKLPRTISTWRYINKVTLFFLKNLVIFYKFVDPLAMDVRGHKGVKPQYSLFNLISKSSNKAPLLIAYDVSCNFYAGFCRIS